MSFYYHMYGQTINRLNLYNNGKVVWNMQGQQGNAWKKASVTLNGNKNVVFEAIRGSSYTGDIAIDSISTVKGTCGGPVPPTPPTAQPPIPPSMSTNFETLGGWVQSKADNFDWRLNKGSTASINTGPSSDQSGSGKYAYIETSSPRRNGDKARLEFKGSYNGDMCMTFYYHMHGQTINALNIYNNNKMVWTMKGQQGRAWKKASVTLNGNQNVIIEGIRGSSYTGDIAIDTLSVAHGRCTAQPTLPPTAPPTAPPSPLPPGSCGKRLVTSRIVGGTEATAHSWPWQAMLTTTSGFAFCGGSLVAPQYVVTATHCISGKSPSTLRVRLGAHNKQTNSGKEQTIDVVQIFAHPQYHKPMRYSNDIAVLKLKEPAILSNAVDVVCLPDARYPLPYDDINKKCYITGWGRLSSGGASPDKLMQASVPLVSKNNCLKGYPGKIDDTMLCAGFDKGGVDACQGDSGGPLVCEFNGRWYLEGATSWGYGCARPGQPGVYALVRSNKSWVQQKINGV
jgi:trypsin